MSELLGKTLKDEITGLTGIANQYVEILGGSPQYSIQPMGDGKVVNEAYGIDVGSVILVEDGPTVEVEEADSTIVVGLGDMVEDIVTGKTGMVTSLTTFINGCIYAIVISKNKSNVLGEAEKMFTSHNRLKVVEKNAFENAKAKAAAGTTPKPQEDSSKRPPGGPNTRSMRPY